MNYQPPASPSSARPSTYAFKDRATYSTLEANKPSKRQLPRCRAIPIAAGLVFSRWEQRHDSIPLKDAAGCHHSVEAEKRAVAALEMARILVPLRAEARHLHRAWHELLARRSHLKTCLKELIATSGDDDFHRIWAWLSANWTAKCFVSNPAIHLVIQSIAHVLIEGGDPNSPEVTAALKALHL